MVFGIGLLGVGLIGGGAVVFGNAVGAAVESCPQGMTEYKVDGNPINSLSVGESASVTVDGQTFTFTKVLGPDPFENDTFDFTSTIPVDLVLVKGGNVDGTGTNEYPYSPAVTSGTALHPPLNGGEVAPAISHVSFCAGDQQETTTSPSTSTSTSTTTSTVPETSSSTESTITSTTSTVPETSSSTESSTTTSTVADTSSSTPTTIGEVGSTETTSSTVEAAVVDQGTSAPSTTAAPVSTSALPFTGSGTLAEITFALSCVLGGALLLRRRKTTKPA